MADGHLRGTNRTQGNDSHELGDDGEDIYKWGYGIARIWTQRPLAIYAESTRKGRTQRISIAWPERKPSTRACLGCFAEIGTS